MIEKFKVGDRARLITNGNYDPEPLNYVFAVQDVSDSMQFISISGDNRTRMWPAHRFERIIPASQKTQ